MPGKLCVEVGFFFFLLSIVDLNTEINTPEF